MSVLKELDAQRDIFRQQQELAREEDEKVRK
mgnify:CR=1 FL=1